MVARRVCVTGVTAAVVYLPLVPVVLSRVNLSIATIFIWVRARLAAAVASHTCLPPPVCVIVVKLSEFWVQTTSRVDKWVSAVSERVSVLMAI